MAASFLDANIIVRHLTQDDPVQSPRATALFERVANEELTVHLTEVVIVEAALVLEREYDQPRRHICDVLTDLLALPGLVLPEKQRVLEALRLYADHNLPFGDACHLARMRELKLTDIISFDRHFSRVPGITRRDP